MPISHHQMTTPLFPLADTLLRPLVQTALQEDLGRIGDITSMAVIPTHSHAQLSLVSRQDGILAGMDLARLAFHLFDDKIEFYPLVNDSEHIQSGQILATVKGNTRALLSAERTALNFLTHLSGIASMTHAAVQQTQGTKAQITCSRKTLPGLRMLQKYAVRAGGGRNHRLGLDDAILIKDNHLIYTKSLTDAILQAKAQAGHLISVEVEVDTLTQLSEALHAGAELVLLDNMTNDMLREAVQMNHKITQSRTQLEASGGIHFDRIAQVAQTGVDFIALGYLTHSSRALDIGFDFLSS